MPKRKANAVELANAQPWHRLENESTKAFEAFRTYLELGINRSQTAVAKQLGKSGTLIHNWSKKYSWVLRVRAHEVHQETFRQAEAERRLQESAVNWVERANAIKHAEFEMSELLLKKAADVIQKLPKATLGDAARAIELAFKLRRLACGLPTDSTEHTHSGAIAMSDCQVVISIPSNWRDVSPNGDIRKPEQIAPPNG